MKSCVQLLRVAIPAAAAIGALMAAGPASAGQIVWEKDSDIWVMDDNGQNQRNLISYFDVPGMSFIGSPHVHPLGGQTIAFTGSTSANNVTFGSRTYGGNNATGVYRWSAGTTTRLSPEPSPCQTPGNACTTFHNDPEVAADGTYVFQSGIAVGNGSSTDFQYRLERGSLATGESSEFPTQCSGENSGLFYGAESPSPNPVNPAEVAYAGCDTGVEDSDYGVWVKTASGSPTMIADSGDALWDPSWTLDGEAVLVSARPTGIYRIARDGSSATLLFSGETSSPRDMGDRILFRSGSELYTIASSCNACTSADATQLTTGGDNGDAAWTSAATFELPDTTAPALGLSFGKAKVRAALARGVPLKLDLDEDAMVRVKLKLKKATVGKATKALAAGRTGLRVKIAKKHARKVKRKRKLQAVVTATDAAGNETTQRGSVKLKR
jgi:hypothetical protein